VRMRMCCARTGRPILRAKAMRALIEGIIEGIASAAAAFVGAAGVRAGCAASVFLEVLAAVASRERMLAEIGAMNSRGAIFRFNKHQDVRNWPHCPRAGTFFIISSADRAGRDACASVPPHTRMRGLGGDALARLLFLCCLKYK